jgi:hypothetical protein
LPRFLINILFLVPPTFLALNSVFWQQIYFVKNEFVVLNTSFKQVRISKKIKKSFELTHEVVYLHTETAG